MTSETLSNFLPWGTESTQAVRLSLLVSLAAVAASLPAGVAAGWVLARRQFPGKFLAETVINLPLVLPPVVTGYVLLVVFGRHGWVGRYLERWLGLEFAFNWKGAALASAVVSFPLMVRAIRLSFSAVDARLEQAARTLGANAWSAFFTVTLPLARGGLVAGALLAFARGMGEFGATVMIASDTPGETRTIPLAIYDRVMNDPNRAGEAWPLIGVSVLISAGALAAGEYLDRRGRARRSGG